MRLGLPAALVAAALALWTATRRLDGSAESPYPVARTLRFDAALVRSAVWAARPDRPLAGADLPVEFAFRIGDKLIEILKELGLERGEAEAVVTEVTRHVDVRRLRTEDRYAALVDTDGALRGFSLTIAGKGRVEVVRQAGAWRSVWQTFERQLRHRRVSGSLDGFLESSIERAGGDPLLAYTMADVLQWDLDFNRDLRVGDRFEVLYERIFLDEQFHRVGGILALSYENRGRRLEAFRFGEDGGYYDAEGRPLRKLFLRSPLRYSRVTSGFSGRRFHPILKRYRPHHGVDYGAPTGTPVRVTANGVVRSVGWAGGGGKTIKVRHANGYLTAYLHLSRFAPGLRPGQRVLQGETIGYVGSTGLATAPHLDYRVQRDGRWINPLTLDNEPAEPVSDDRLADFLAWRDRLRESLAGDAPPTDLAAGELAPQVAKLDEAPPGLDLEVSLDR